MSDFNDFTNTFDITKCILRRIDSVLISVSRPIQTKTILIPNIRLNSNGICSNTVCYSVDIIIALDQCFNRMTKTNNRSVSKMARRSENYRLAGIIMSIVDRPLIK